MVLLMYTILQNPKVMAKTEIDNTFAGRWVYIVNADINAHGKLIEGMPVVIGDYQFEGVDEGIYRQFDNIEYGRTLSYTLLPLDNTITSAFGVGFA